MRLRVLVTNGSRTIDLFWLSHDGVDVYCGPNKFDSKRSYHKSGKVHTKADGVCNNEGWHQPLASIRGQFHLSTINIGDASQFVELADQKYEYGGKKTDACLIVDSRSIPSNVQANIAIGLLEPGNFEAISHLTIKQEFSEFESISCEQILLKTSVNPWVYVIVHWWKLPINT